MLEVRNLEKSFGPKQVLFGVDFQGKSRKDSGAWWERMVLGKQRFSTVC